MQLMSRFELCDIKLGSTYGLASLSLASMPVVRARFIPCWWAFGFGNEGLDALAGAVGSGGFSGFSNWPAPHDAKLL